MNNSMSAAKHTPWIRDGKRVHFGSDDFSPVVEMPSTDAARLIAAAPDLLAALEVTQTQLRALSFKDAGISAALEKCAAAIAKAGCAA
jgi:hypothetical protein